MDIVSHDLQDIILNAQSPPAFASLTMWQLQHAWRRDRVKRSVFSIGIFIMAMERNKSSMMIQMCFSSLSTDVTTSSFTLTTKIWHLITLEKIKENSRLLMSRGRLEWLWMREIG